MIYEIALKRRLLLQHEIELCYVEYEIIWWRDSKLALIMVVVTLQLADKHNCSKLLGPMGQFCLFVSSVDDDKVKGKENSR